VMGAGAGADPGRRGPREGRGEGERARRERNKKEGGRPALNIESRKSYKYGKCRARRRVVGGAKIPAKFSVKNVNQRSRRANRGKEALSTAVARIYLCHSWTVSRNSSASTSIHMFTAGARPRLSIPKRPHGGEKLGVCSSKHHIITRIILKKSNLSQGPE